jgi:hypothetical protein
MPCLCQSQVRVRNVTVSAPVAAMRAINSTSIPSFRANWTTPQRKCGILGPHNRWGLPESPASIELRAKISGKSDSCDTPECTIVDALPGRFEGNKARDIVLRGSDANIEEILLRELVTKPNVAAERRLTMIHDD